MKRAIMRFLLSPVLLSLVLLSLVLLSPGMAVAQGGISFTLDSVRSGSIAEPYDKTLPGRVDLSARLPRPRNQASTDTCGSWAATYAAASEAVQRNNTPKAPLVPLSPAFTYPLAGGSSICKGPTSLARTLDLLRDTGALPLEEYRFDAGWCGRIPTEAEFNRAARFRIRGWSRLDASDQTAVKGQLAKGRPVLFSMQAGPAFSAHRGDAAFNQVETGRNTFGHSMVLVGYDDARQAFRVMNSWGPSWGNGGYAWLSYLWWHGIMPARAAAYVID